MEPLQTAQQSLYKALSRASIERYDGPTINGYKIEEYSNFKQELNSLYDKYEAELNKIENSSEAELFLLEISDAILQIKEKIINYRKEQIHDEEKIDPGSFSRFRLQHIGYFLNFQLEIINKTESELAKKLARLKNPEDQSGHESSAADTPILTNKIKSKLSKVDLVTLFWWLAEAGLLEFEDSHDYFVKFLQNNFQFYDRRKIFVDMKDVGSTMSKLINSDSPETNPVHARKKLLEILENTVLPPEKPKLHKNAWKQA